MAHCVSLIPVTPHNATTVPVIETCLPKTVPRRSNSCTQTENLFVQYQKFMFQLLHTQSQLHAIIRAVACTTVTVASETILPHNQQM